MRVLSLSLLLVALLGRVSSVNATFFSCVHKDITHGVQSYNVNDLEDCTPNCNGKTDLGCVAKITCQSGYVLSGVTQIACTWKNKNYPWMGAYWNYDRPVCVPAQSHGCSEVLSINEGGTVAYNATQVTYSDGTKGYPAYTTATFSCDQSGTAPVMDYDGVPSNVVKCLPNGEWSGDAPQCTPTDCTNYVDPKKCIAPSTYTVTTAPTGWSCKTFLTSSSAFGPQKSTCCADKTSAQYGLCQTSSNCNGMQFMICNGGNCPNLGTNIKCKAVNPTACTSSASGKCWGTIECPNNICPKGHFGDTAIYPGMVCIADGNSGNPKDSVANNVPTSGYLTGNVKICGSCGTCIAPQAMVDSLGHCCPSAAYVWDSVNNVCKPSGAKGDPQFTGFLGQDYQVHGTSNTDYNIISTPSLQYNAHFTYLNEGKCRVGTQCFSHPGNYFGSVGISIRDERGDVQKFLVQSGSVETGLRVTINGEIELEVSEHELTVGNYTVSMPNQFEFIMESDELNLKVENSDLFLNQDVSIGRGLMTQIANYKSLARTNKAAAADVEMTLPHGILGQTWQNRQHNNRWKHIEGQLFDYVVPSLFGTEFRFNRF